MDKYVIAPPEGSTNNSVGAADRHWGKGYFDELPGYNEYLAESTGYGIVSGCDPTISGLTVTVGAGIVHLADGTRKEISATNITLDNADSTNPRIDLVYIDSTGAVAKVTGTAATSPSAPDVPTGGISVCNVTIAAGATTGTVNHVQTIAPNLANYGVVNVKDFGAVGDGVTDDTAAILLAIDKATEKKSGVFFPAGTYAIGKTLPFSCSLIGELGRNTTIKAMNGFDGDYMVEFYNYQYYKKIENISFDAREQAGIFGSSYQGSGSSISHFDNVAFYQSASDKYAIDFYSSISVAGGLTGALFTRCSFEGNTLVLRVANNMDEVLFQSCRFGSPVGVGSTFAYNVTGSITFQSCYFALPQDTYSYAGIKSLFLVGGSSQCFRDCSFETTMASSLQYLFFIATTAATFKVINCAANFSLGNNFISLIRYAANNDTYDINVEINNFKDSMYAGFGFALCETFIGANLTGDVNANLYVSGCDSFAKLWQKAASSNDTSYTVINIDGDYKNTALVGDAYNSTGYYKRKTQILNKSGSQVSTSGTITWTIGIPNADNLCVAKIKTNPNNIAFIATKTIFVCGGNVATLFDTVSQGNSWFKISSINATSDGNSITITVTATGTSVGESKTYKMDVDFILL